MKKPLIVVVIALAELLDVGDQVAMGQHHALREPGRA